MQTIQYINETYPLFFCILSLLLAIIVIAATATAIWAENQKLLARKTISNLDTELRGHQLAAEKLLAINQSTIKISGEQAIRIAELEQQGVESLLLYQNQTTYIQSLQTKLGKSELEAFYANKRFAEAPIFAEITNENPKPTASKKYFGLYVPLTNEAYLFLPSAMANAKKTADKNLEDVQRLKNFSPTKNQHNADNNQQKEN